MSDIGIVSSIATHNVTTQTRLEAYSKRVFNVHVLQN